MEFKYTAGGMLSTKYPYKFNYFKWGECPSCQDPDARLYKPEFTGDTRIVLFEPICRRCAELVK